MWTCIPFPVESNKGLAMKLATKPCFCAVPLINLFRSAASSAALVAEEQCLKLTSNCPAAYSLEITLAGIFCDFEKFSMSFKKGENSSKSSILYTCVFAVL